MQRRDKEVPNNLQVEAVLLALHCERIYCLTLGRSQDWPVRDRRHKRVTRVNQSARVMSSNSAKTLLSIVAATTAVAAVSSYVTARVYKKRERAIEVQLSKLEETRKAERRGRTRAEIKLRTHLKEQQQCKSTGQGDQSTENGRENELHMEAIGTCVSPYTKRMGTPRQGKLVPSGRGYIQLNIPAEVLDGMEEYSHAWVIFTFHANTDSPAGLNLAKTKIRPPRGDGRKVGMLATRSPHRPNNVGLSLVKVCSVDKKKRRLHVSALDLVNGTPVYDIKPVVPWDSPGELSVPKWVSQDDQLKSAKFTPDAKEAFEMLHSRGHLSPLYVDSLEEATKAVCEILSQDPRVKPIDDDVSCPDICALTFHSKASNSSGPNKRGSEGDAIYTMLFCSVEITFRVDKGGVTVVRVQGIDLSRISHVDGIPILDLNTTE